MDSKDSGQFIIVFEDGTPIEEAPKNPLWDKWVSTLVKKDDGTSCQSYFYTESGKLLANYSCVLCNSHVCPYSDNFVVPEEDREEYEKWNKEYKAFANLHNKVEQILSHYS